MSNVYELPSQEEIYDQASLWIARLDRSLSKLEEQKLKSWLGQDNRHQEVLFEMASLWDSMDVLSRLSSLFPVPTRSSRPLHTRFYFAAAASFLVMVLVGVFGVLKFAPSIAPQWILALHVNQNIDGVYDTGVGEHSRVNLPDGSTIVLNTNSRIQVKYSDDSRLFYLDHGEVHIDVAHDKSRPLSVIAGGKVVQAVGTAFNVQIFENQIIELIVTEGKVLVAEYSSEVSFDDTKQERLPSSSLAVSKGEIIVLGNKEEKIKKIDASEIEANLSWRDGNLVFRGETLKEALAEISRYTDVQFEIEDEKVGQIRIAGMFKAGDVKGLLVTLEKNFHIDHQRLGSNKVTLRSM